MDTAKRLGCALTLLCAWATAQAQAVCYLYTVESLFGGGTYGSASEAGSAGVAYRTAHTSQWNDGINSFNTVFTFEGCSGSATGGSGSLSCTYAYQRTPVPGVSECYGSGGVVNCTLNTGQEMGVGYITNPDGCPPQECDLDAPGVGEQFATANVEGPNEYCNVVSHCKMQVISRVGPVMTVRHTSGGCSDPSDPGDPADPQEGDPEACESVGDGEYCASASGDGQCGYFNDSFVCLGKIKPDECAMVGSDGGRICGPQATTTPPVPDNGTPGTPATPDASLTALVPDPNDPESTTNTTYNYYGGGTVTASSRDPGTTGEGPTSSGVGGSEGNGPGEEEIGQAIGPAGTLPETEHNLADALEEDLLSWGSDECPAPVTVEFYGQAFEITAITYLCTLAEMISGLVMAMAYLGALAIVFKG